MISAPELNENLRNKLKGPLNIRSLKKVAIYGAAITLGALLCGFIGYEISHEIFNSISESPSDLVQTVEALSQSVQDTYATLGGAVGGAIAGGYSARRITR